MEVLLLLAQEHGGVVHRDRIVRELWGDSSNGNDDLIHCVSELRQALGDDPDKPGYIRTIPERGYQLVGSVQKTISTPTAPLTHDAPNPTDQGSLIGVLIELRRRRVFRVLAPTRSWYGS